VNQKHDQAVQISRVILYVRDIPKVATFYQTHFGFRPLPGTEPGWLELAAPGGGSSIALHQASKGQKRGSEIKIVFGVRDVRGFKAGCEANGLRFGVVHDAGGFQFSNARDPAGNSISISSRGMK
jgi:catechol 2,3-dioxygenase-like lactoylglutathione lyase family enzyme